MTQYLVLPRIKACDCNLESSHFAISFPLTAAAGLVELAYAELQEVVLAIRSSRTYHFGEIHSVAFILHEYQTYQGISKNPLGLCRKNGAAPAEKDLQNPPTIYEVKGRVSFSMVVRLERSDMGAFFLDDVAREFKRRLLGLHFAGGNILSIGLNQSQQPMQLAFPTFVAAGTLFDTITRLPRGWFIKHRPDLIQSEEKLQSLLDAVALYQSETGRFYRRQPGWVYATCNGYQLLEEPCDREARRSEDYLHAYAEPVHTLAELVHARSLLRRFKDTPHTAAANMEQDKLFWRWEADNASRCCILTAAK